MDVFCVVVPSNGTCSSSDAANSLQEVFCNCTGVAAGMIDFKPHNAAIVIINSPVNTKPKELTFCGSIDMPNKDWSIGLVLTSD